MSKLEAALAAQERKRRLDREKRDNAPAAKRKREERERKHQESMQLFMARLAAERRDEQAPPLYEVIADAFDLADPKLEALRLRMVTTIQRAIADMEYQTWIRGEERERRLARARELLAALKPARAIEAAIDGEGPPRRGISRAAGR
jgi:hypothetical protein